MRQLLFIILAGVASIASFGVYHPARPADYLFTYPRYPDLVKGDGFKSVTVGGKDLFPLRYEELSWLEELLWERAAVGGYPFSSLSDYSQSNIHFCRPATNRHDVLYHLVGGSWQPITNIAPIVWANPMSGGNPGVMWHKSSFTIRINASDFRPALVPGIYYNLFGVTNAPGYLYNAWLREDASLLDSFVTNTTDLSLPTPDVSWVVSDSDTYTALTELPVWGSPLNRGYVTNTVRVIEGATRKILTPGVGGTEYARVEKTHSDNWENGHLSPSGPGMDEPGSYTYVTTNDIGDGYTLYRRLYRSRVGRDERVNNTGHNWQTIDLEGSESKTIRFVTRTNTVSVALGVPACVLTAGVPSGSRISNVTMYIAAEATVKTETSSSLYEGYRRPADVPVSSYPWPENSSYYYTNHTRTVSGAFKATSTSIRLPDHISPEYDTAYVVSEIDVGSVVEWLGLPTEITESPSLPDLTFSDPFTSDPELTEEDPYPGLDCSAIGDTSIDVSFVTLYCLFLDVTFDFTTKR